MLSTTIVRAMRTAAALALLAGAPASLAQGGADRPDTKQTPPTRHDADQRSRDARRDAGPADYRSTKWLASRDIVGADGRDKIAGATDLIIDRGSGRIAYVVAKTGAVLGLGGKSIAVPYEAFEWNGADEKFRLSATKEQLAQFPEFDADEWSAMLESRQGKGSALYERLSGETTAYTDPYAGAFKDSKRERVEGQVKRVDRVEMGGVEHTVLVVDTGAGERRVTLGPSWYVSGGAFHPTRGDKVVVETYALPRDDVRVASRIESGDRRLAFRDKEGAPLWSMRSVESSGKTYASAAWRFALESTLRGAKADCHGAECGKVDDLIANRESGWIEFVSLDPNENFLGIGDTKRLVPWSIVSVAADGSVRIDTSKEMALASPETPSELATMNTGPQAEGAYRAYQVSPPERRRATTREREPISGGPDTNAAWRKDGPILSSMDASTDRTLRGTVVSSRTIPFDNGVPAAQAVVVKTSDGEETVIVGPTWYMARQSYAWKQGGPVTLEVRRVRINDKPYWIARSGEHEGAALRTWDGDRPAWDNR